MTYADLLPLILYPKELTLSAITAIRNNPTRVYSIVAAAVALVVFYVPSIPAALVLALAAAILGTGEVVRANVTPEAKAQARELDAYQTGVSMGQVIHPPESPKPTP